MPRSKQQQDIESKAEQMISNATHKSSLSIKTLLQEMEEHNSECQNRGKNLQEFVELFEKMNHHTNEEVEKSIKSNKKLLQNAEDLNQWFENQLLQAKQLRQQKWEDFRSNLKI